MGDIFCDVELGGSLGVLAIAHILAVDVEFHGGLDGSELQHHSPALPLCRHLEVGCIAAHGIVILGHIGRIGRKLVNGVHIDRNSVALQFQVARHLDFAPFVDVVFLGVEILGNIGRPFHIL